MAYSYVYITVTRSRTLLSRFTPADIQYLFEQVAQYAFEQEMARKADFKVCTDTILRFMEGIRHSLTDEIIEEFAKDGLAYSRV